MTPWLREQVRLLLLAVQLLTRIPVRVGPPGPGDLARALRWAPLVGAGVGGAGALVHASELPPLLAAACAVGVTAALTGALHEDGLADTLDGLGGGRTPGDALRIMKDSRIGAYGALGLVLVTAGRIAGVAALPGAALVGAHALSRFAMLVPLAVLPPARPGGTGAPVSGGPGLWGWAAAAATVAVAWAGQDRLLAAALVCCGASWLFTEHLRRRLGGYTGDTLGAVQQGTELLTYIVLAWHGAWRGG